MGVICCFSSNFGPISKPLTGIIQRKESEHIVGRDFFSSFLSLVAHLFSPPRKRRKKPYARKVACFRANMKDSWIQEPNVGSSRKREVLNDEPTWRCRQNPSIGALRIQEPVILR